MKEKESTQYNQLKNINMSNSIEVKWEASQDSGQEFITFEQMNTTQEKFCKLSRSEQGELLQEALHELPERVSIVVDSFHIED